MDNIILTSNEDNAKFERCVDFLVRMLEKYGSQIRMATTEEIRAEFHEHQCHKAA